MKNFAYIAAALGVGSSLGTLSALQEPTTDLKNYYEIVVSNALGIADAYNKLDKEEKVLAYYLWRATISVNRMAADQMHRHALALKAIFENIYKNREIIEPILGKEFIKEAELYLVYLWTNHGQYFLREHARNKRTPETLKLKALTPEHIALALKIINKQELLTPAIERTLFDSEYEHTATVPGDIEQSGVNIYSPEFTNADYAQLPADKRGHINAYYTHDKENKPAVEYYSAQGKYSAEIKNSIYWFEKAYNYAQKHTKFFDKYFIESLRYLIEYLKTGDEELFKKHSIAWLKSESKIDYNYGFIEVYDDPMQTTGSIQGEVTVKVVALDKLKSILPGIEEKLPLPEEFKRVNREVLPNASINVKLIGTGHLGPIRMVAAYCLPNYEEIRSEEGSKQIIYPSERPIAQALNPQKSRMLTHIPEHAVWLDKHDPQDRLFTDIDNVQTILHETLGHGSGALAKHTFREGDLLTIGQVTYKPGDTIQVTSDNGSDFLNGYESALEELRAEIIALYVSTHNLKELVSQGFLADWYKLLGDDLIDWVIITMAERGLRRMISQAENAQEVAGAHAQANSTIMYYLLEHGGIELKTEEVTVDNQKYYVSGIEVTDRKKALEGITKLMQEVQRIKSTGDTQDVKTLIENYGKVIKFPEIFKAIRANHKALVGDIKAVAHIYPYFTPIIDNKTGEISDIEAKWPKDITEQHELYNKLEHSQELN